jgi:hypothetical protein
LLADSLNVRKVSETVIAKLPLSAMSGPSIGLGIDRFESKGGHFRFMRDRQQLISKHPATLSDVEKHKIC